MLLLILVIKAIVFYKYTTGFNYSSINIDALNVSVECSLGLKRYVNGILTGEDWAVEMSDAASKAEAGLANGNMGSFGEFDQCINSEWRNESEVIYGKYCFGGLGLTFHIHAVCFPNVCSLREFQLFYAKLGFTFNGLEELCQTRFSRPKLDNSAIAAIVALLFIVGFCALSTTYDLISTGKKLGKFKAAFLKFSLSRNCKKLLEVSTNSNEITCLYGIRTITMMWIILGHRYGFYSYYPLANYKDFYNFASSSRSMFIQNAYFGVDTFFVISGIVLAYTNFSAAAKGVKFNILLFYLHRYIRVTVLLAILLIVHLTLTKYIAFNPIWRIVDHTLRTPCETHWWSTLLHVQNYVNPDQICIGPSWYLSVDMQLYLLSPLILFPLRRWPKLGYILIWILFFCSVGTTMYFVWTYKLHISLVDQLQNLETGKMFNRYHHYPIHARVGPWLVGVFVGCLLYRNKKQSMSVLSKHKYGKAAALALLGLSLAILATCVFAGFHVLNNYDRLWTTISLSLKPVSWAIALGCLIYICDIGYGGPINTFLSLQAFQFLSKMTFAMFLIHFFVQFAIICGFNYDTPKFSMFRMAHAFWGDYIITLSVAILLVIFIEYPASELQKMLLSRKPAKDERVVRPEP